MENKKNYEGWAIVELYGHAQEIGFVTTEYYGSACFFRVDVPALDDRELELERPDYVDGSLVPKGSKVKRPGVPARSRLLGPNAIYALNPCTEEAARLAIDRSIHRELILLSVPDGAGSPRITSGDARLGDMCAECGRSLEECICEN